MASGQPNGALRQLRSATVLQDGGLTDGQLLDRFITQRDQAAFEALVQRHGPMVWGVCRRVLRNPHDTEDAFQATFLVLVRKAAALGQRELVGNWLYGAAYRAALEAKALARRRRKEKQVSALPEPVVPSPPGWDDLRPVLDRELSRLPGKYRVAIVLCDLEGRTRREEARQLAIPEGTLSSRLAAGRRLLAGRLARYGLSIPGGALAAALSQGVAPAGVPPPVVVSTIQAATALAAGHAAAGALSANVAALTEGVLKAMLLTKLKNVALLALLVASVLGTLTALAIGQNPTSPVGASPKAKAITASKVEPQKEDTAEKEPEKRFENAPGWSWYGGQPGPRQELGANMGTAHGSGRGFSAIFETDKDGALLVYLAFRKTNAALDYRPVAFNAARKRYPLKPAASSGHHDVRLARFRLDPQVLPANQAEYLGFEYLTADGRKIAANDATARAKKAGLETLPFPEVGQAYDFTLTALDGKPVRARDLHGKVVLVDCWATWCSPCMAKMPQLKELYEKHHKEGLEIVGACFDQDAADAQAAIKRLGLGWAQVLVPAEEKARALWMEAAGIEALPRLLLIDRDGVLRADCAPYELKAQITELLSPKPATGTKP